MSGYLLVHRYHAVNVYRAGAVAKVELHRPAQMNAWNKQLGLDLRAAVQRVGDDPEIRAVLITGAGPGFSGGADIKEEGAERTPEGHKNVYARLTEVYHPALTGIREMPKPVIGVVHGAAAGIGVSLALSCDLVAAAESAYFVLAFVNIGLVPDGGASFLVPSRVGFTRAAELAMLGGRIGARQALDWGLINRVWPDEELPARAGDLAALLASGPTRSYAATKRELNRWLYGQMDQQLELEARLQQDMMATRDYTEGVAAFREKRAPRFLGQ
jgi:2-(1,2-epoxy-1,2-dihydrophenyl)acetyl-CoA isomerase